MNATMDGKTALTAIEITTNAKRVAMAAIQKAAKQRGKREFATLIGTGNINYQKRISQAVLASLESKQTLYGVNTLYGPVFTTNPRDMGNCAFLIEGRKVYFVKENWDAVYQSNDGEIVWEKHLQIIVE